MKNLYEHHVAIENNRLCPFKLHKSTIHTELGINWHKNIEILIVESGEGFVKYGADDLPVCPGDIVIVNSGTMHSLYSEKGMTYSCLIISDKFFLENGININNYKFKKLVRDNVTQTKFMEVASEITYANAQNTLSVAVMRKSVLELMIDICSKHLSPIEDGVTKKFSSEAYVKKAVSYINDNYTQGLTLESIADYVGISKYHMAREFKKYTGQTPFTYINIMRCKKADICISEGMSITETAMECGFETVSYFSRTYKKLMGINPSKAKRK